MDRADCRPKLSALCEGVEERGGAGCSQLEEEVVEVGHDGGNRGIDQWIAVRDTQYQRRRG